METGEASCSWAWERPAGRDRPQDRMYGETGVKIRWQTFCGGCFAGSDPLQVRRAVLGDRRPHHQRVVPPEAQPFPSDFTEPVVNAVAVQLLQAHESVDGHQDGGYALNSAAFIAPSLVFKAARLPSVGASENSARG